MDVHLIQIGSAAWDEMLQKQFEFFEKKFSELGNRSSSDPLDDWVNVKTAMRLLNVGRTKLQEMKNAGVIHFTQDKKKLQFSRKSIADYKRKHSTLG